MYVLCGYCSTIVKFFGGGGGGAACIICRIN